MLVLSYIDLITVKKNPYFIIQCLFESTAIFILSEICSLKTYSKVMQNIIIVLFI